MTCCGNSRHRPPSAVAEAARSARGPVLFEYGGSDPLTIYGRATGIRYHFPGPSARARVHPRDAPVLEVVRGLRVVDKATPTEKG
jgi:hypothetical protein